MVLPFDINNIFSQTPAAFNEICVAVYEYQYANNPIYQSWVKLVQPEQPIEKIPYLLPTLPISFFKTADIITGGMQAEKIFESSGTTGMITSRHLVANLRLYEQSFMATFESFYGNVKDWCIIALLPAYLERQNSSLVYMAHELIERSGHPNSGFYLYNYEELAQILSLLEARGQKTFLLGVTFALLDFAAEYPMQFKHTVVVETGGMKGRGREHTRMELHEILQNKLGRQQIHAEYGMTELLSQAYSAGGGRYYCPPWMRVYIRHEDDPLEVAVEGIGLLQIIDLANVYSCAFIATQDIGRVYADGSFEVLGRMDNSDLRGCSLLVV